MHISCTIVDIPVIYFKCNLLDSLDRGFDFKFPNICSRSLGDFLAMHLSRENL